MNGSAYILGYEDLISKPSVEISNIWEPLTMKDIPIRITAVRKEKIRRMQ